MFSAWRKLTKKQDDRHVFPTGVARVEQSMQKKFSKGVQYNLKIIIKGDRNTGKSTLLQRLSGSPFKENYIPTQEIQVANINWNYRGACDIVKVEVWDIVDKSSRKRTPSDSLKLTNVDDNTAEGLADQFSLDAELINVYKGTHGVILTMDITKAWTWQYVQRELDKIPNHIPVLVLANFRDMGDHRVVQTDEVAAYVEHLDRPVGSAEVYFSESSMKDGFGLKFIYKYLNMPFLILQRESLLKQLKSNALEIEDMREFLTVDMSSEDQNYNLFHEMLTKKVEPTMSPMLSPETEAPQTIDIPAQNVVAEAEKAKVNVDVKTDRKQLPIATVPPTVHNIEETDNEVVVNTEEISPTAAEPLKTSMFQSYKAKLFGSDETKKAVETAVPPVESGSTDVPIEEFHPGSLDDSFLNSSSKHVATKPSLTKLNSDSEDEDRNPMVAAYEDLSSDDEVVNDDKAFIEEEFSFDNEFDDLSDDERPQLQPSSISIIDQVKKTRKQKVESDKESDENTDYNVITEDIDVDVSYDHLDMLDIKSEQIAAQNTINIQQITDPNNDIQNTDQIHDIDTSVVNVDVIDDVDPSFNQLDVESDDDSPTFVVTADVGLDEQDDDYVTDAAIDDVIDAAVNDVTDDVIKGENKFQDESDNVNLDEESVTDEPASSGGFDLNDLEMFMSNQMTKAHPSDQEKLNDKETITTAVKKKKKKKVVTSDVQVNEPNVADKPRKKKKKKTAVVDETPIASKKTDDLSIKTDKSNKTKKQRTRTDSQSGVTTEKKVKKKKEKIERSELDAFLDG